MKFLLWPGLLFVLFVGSITQSRSQNSREVVSGTFVNMPFPEVVRELESKPVYRFYYSPAAVDSLRITAEGRGKKISTFLNEVLQGTQLHFVIDGRGRIYITNGQPIQAALPGDFFNGETKTAEAVPTQTFLDFPDM